MFFDKYEKHIMKIASKIAKNKRINQLDNVFVITYHLLT